MTNWSTTVTVKPKSLSKRTRSKAPRNIKIFKKCVDMLSDEYWINIFEGAYRGDFPPKFSYNEEYRRLLFRNGSKSFFITVSDNPFDALSKCTSFFREHGGLHSGMDQIDEHRTIKQHNDDADDWSKLHTKTRNILIDYFVEDEKNKHNLNHNEITQLRECINVGFSIGMFRGGTATREKTIHVENYCITSFDGLKLEYNNGKRMYVLNGIATKSKVTSRSNKRPIKRHITYGERWKNLIDYVISNVNINNTDNDFIIESNDDINIYNNNGDVQSDDYKQSSSDSDEEVDIYNESFT